MIFVAAFAVKEGSKEERAVDGSSRVLTGQQSFLSSLTITRQLGTPVGCPNALVFLGTPPTIGKYHGLRCQLLAMPTETNDVRRPTLVCRPELTIQTPTAQLRSLLLLALEKHRNGRQKINAWAEQVSVTWACSAVPSIIIGRCALRLFASGDWQRSCLETGNQLRSRSADSAQAVQVERVRSPSLVQRALA